VSLGAAKPRRGGRFGRSPFSRPQCTECEKTTPYGTPMIRIEISLPTPDMNEVMARGIFGSKGCAQAWLEKVQLP